MLKSLKKYYAKQHYRPDFVGIFVNPFYIARRGLYRNIADLSGNITGKTLDVGCGQRPYESLFRSANYVGLEIDSPENRKSKKADVFYDGTVFPFPDDEFDSIVANQVLEHVFNPGLFLSEIRRVLKKEGMLLLTAPFVWDEHEQPYDYARYSSFGLRDLLENSGFAVVEHRKSIRDIRVVFQMLNDYIYKKTAGRSRYWNLLMTMVLMAPFSILGELLSLVLPKNNDLYLDNVILAKKVSDA